METTTTRILTGHFFPLSFSIEIHIAFKLRIKCMRIIVLFSLCFLKTNRNALRFGALFWCWFSFYVDIPFEMWVVSVCAVLPYSQNHHTPSCLAFYSSPYISHARSHKLHALHTHIRIDVVLRTGEEKKTESNAGSRSTEQKKRTRK